MKYVKIKEHFKHRHICGHCQGNGFREKFQVILQIWNWKLGYKRVKQCTTCKSEGEIYDPKLIAMDYETRARNDYSNYFD